MIYTHNNTITIKRLSESVGEKTYSETIVSGLSAYIEPIEDTIGMDSNGMSAYNVFRCFIPGKIESFLILEELTNALSTYTMSLNELIGQGKIQIGDKIIDKDGIEYKVKGVKDLDSFLGSQFECLIQSVYD